MQFLVFIIIYPFIWLLSNLPLKVLYFISDGIYYLLYYIIGYRKKTVMGNLRLAFPDKSEHEIKTISKKFYRHFVDIFTEILKSFTISKNEMAKRYKFDNLDVFHKLESDNRSSILLGAHFANWEWIFALNLLIKSHGYAVYKRIQNPFFDKQVQKTRGKLNTTLVSTKEIFSLIENNSKKNILSIYGFLGDQSPKLSRADHYTNFLGISVPAHVGAEVLSKKYNLPIVFFATRKIKRGYYECTLKLLVDNPKKYKDYEITDLFLLEVEKQIRENPEHYFWSHKRFKHMKKKLD